MRFINELPEYSKHLQTNKLIFCIHIVWQMPFNTFISTNKKEIIINVEHSFEQQTPLFYSLAAKKIEC